MKWLELKLESKKPDRIVAITDTGLMKRHNGVIEPIPYRQNITLNGKKVRAYRILAENFLPKTEEDIKLGRDCIDHITHNPTDMNINDIRNMRWCTYKENNNFDEAKQRKAVSFANRNEDWCRRISESLKGKPSWNKGLHGGEYLSHYKLGRTYNSLLDSPLGG